MADNNTSLIKHANTLSDNLWNIIQFWGVFAKETIGNHLLYSIDKLSNELIIQGKTGKGTEKVKLHYYYIETHSWLDKARRRKLIDRQVYHQLYTSLKELGDMISK